MGNNRISKGRNNPMAERARAAKNGDATNDEIEQLASSRRKAAKGKKAAKNAGPVSDETIGMHIGLIKDAEAKWRKLRDEATQAQGVLRNRYKVAKNDGVDVDSLKLAFRIAERVSGEVISEQRAVGRYLRIMGAPIGTQWSLFDEVEIEGGDGPKVDPNLQGQHAGRNGEPAENNPFTPGTEPFTEWAAGWVNGQEMLASGVGAH